jgi:aminodeoxychorismate synthase component I
MQGASQQGSLQGEGSFVIFGKPAFSISLEGGTVTVTLPQRRFITCQNPLSLLEGYLEEGYVAIGYLGYGFSRFTEEGFIPSRKKEGDLLPDVFFHFFRKEDGVSGRLQDLGGLIKAGFGEDALCAPGVGEAPCRIRSNMTKDEYIEMVRRAKDYIAGGDVYQVNLSQRFTATLGFSPLSYFLNLYGVQPVPFGCYMDFGEFQLISGSMELFLRKTGRKLITKPIKGTRSRGYTSESDAILKAELRGSEKERAENLMIVDLMRNDLGRVCGYGTVRVNSLFDIESYSTLHQMVSEIEGHIGPEVGIGDIIVATFPPGSVTGAPKRRALEIIDELEPHLRGPYCGALGVFMPDGDFTLSVAIRVLIAKKGRGVFWTGSGIVWDSDPDKEYEETLVKARAIKKALGVTE